MPAPIGWANDDAAPPQTFTIGRISQYPEDELDRLIAMSDWLKANLENGDSIDFQHVIVPSLSEMQALIASGKVDMISETPYAALMLEQNGAAEVILRERKFGVKEYHSLLVGRSALESGGLGSLKGKIIALEDPGSTSGFFLPLSILINANITPVEVTSLEASVNQDHVGYFFAGSVEAAINLTSEGKVAAFALSDYDWSRLREIPRNLRGDIRVLGTSQSVMRSLVLVGKHVPLTLVGELCDLLPTMIETENGWKTMRAYNRVRGFDIVQGPLLEELAQIRKLHAEVTALIN